MNPQQYVNALKAGQKLTPADTQGLCGRIIRGKAPADFETLSDDRSRLVVMLTDSEGLTTLCGKTDYECLVVIGHHPDHIKGKLSTTPPHSYKLVVFPAQEAILANWSGVFDLATRLYPELNQPVSAFGSILSSGPFRIQDGKSVAFRSIERQAGYNFMDADKSSDPRFMTIEKFRASERGPVELRALLYHTMHLRELFMGDGYTYDEKGNRGVREYVLPNKRIAEISGAVVADMDVRLPAGA
jgi:hypothetical protein